MKNVDELVSWIVNELKAYTVRADQGDFLKFLYKISLQVFNADEDKFKNVVVTMIETEDKQIASWGMTIANEFNVIEAIESIENLLSKVQSGAIWSPYYSSYIQNHLDILVSSNKNSE